MEISRNRIAYIIQSHAVLMGIVRQVVPISLSILLINGASKLGAFRDRFGEEFKEEMKETQRLKAMSEERMDNLAGETLPRY